MNLAVRTRHLARVWVDAAALPAARVQELANRLGPDHGGPFMVQPILEQRADGEMLRRHILVNRTRNILFSILTDSFDFVALPAPATAGANMRTFAEFATEAAPALALALETTGLRAKRMALVEEGLLRELDDATIDAMRRRIVSAPDDLVDGSAPFEWDWRIARRMPLELGGNQEPTNVIAMAKRARMDLGPLLGPLQAAGAAPGAVWADRIFVSLDVNTVPDNEEARFDVAGVRRFFELGAELHRTGGAALERFLGVADAAR